MNIFRRIVVIVTRDRKIEVSRKERPAFVSFPSESPFPTKRIETQRKVRRSVGTLRLQFEVMSNMMQSTAYVLSLTHIVIEQEQ